MNSKLFAYIVVLAASFVLLFNGLRVLSQKTATPTVSENPVTAALGAATPTGTPPIVAENPFSGCAFMRVFVHNTPVFNEEGVVVNHISAPDMSSPAKVTICAITEDYVFVRLNTGVYGYIPKQNVDSLDLVTGRDSLPVHPNPF